MSHSSVAAAQSLYLSYFDGSCRTVTVTEREIPFPDGCVIVSRTNPEGIITHVNQALAEISGYHQQELIGQPHCLLRHPDMPAEVFAQMWQVIGSGRRWMGYLKNRCKDGSYYWVKATVMPNIRQGRLLGYTSVRKKPSRIKVAECETLYARMRAETES
ncbi:MAG: PAS domain-containing protein [Marinobacterium sp.]|nr:PAS domain-containing protein [Marinobacterium sp.]